MPVTGGKRVADALRRAPQTVKPRLQDAIQDAATLVLQDMRAFTPRDASNPGPHAQDALTITYENEGLTAHIGLPTAQLTRDFFWFRFIDLGTKGGEVRFRRFDTGKFYTMNVPARAALRIRERALEGNLDEVDRLIRAAIAQGFDQ